MAVLIGDPIVRMRAAGPDPCGVLPPPPDTQIVADNPGGSLPVGFIYVVTTWRTPWGETMPSLEHAVQLTDFSHSVVITYTTVPGATAMRAYFGTSASAEAQFVEFDLSNVLAGTAMSSFITGAGQPGLPPRKSSAYLPDTDGIFVDANLAFSWLTQALKQMVVQLGGIPDITGVAWPSQQAWARLPNRFVELTNIWWSGWWQCSGSQEYTWLQSPVQAVPGYATPWSSAGSDLIGLWPQPGSGPATTKLILNTGPTSLDATDGVPAMNAQDTSFAVTRGSLAAFKSPGLVMIDNEIMGVSVPDSTNSIYQGVIRGLGGTLPAQHNVGATVTQLIVMITGKRTTGEFVSGMSYSPLQLPVGWDVPIDEYLIGKFREKEQEHEVAAQKFQLFNQMIEQLRSSRDAVPKGRQVGDARVYESFSGYRTGYPFSIIWQ
jgi:hypothetical protein